MATLNYFEGETKKVPGVYQRQSNAGGITVASAVNGIGAIAIKADWGPLNDVERFTGSAASTALTAAYGTTGGVPTALAFLAGGLTTLYVYRVGTGGTAATATLDAAITLSTKYPTTRSFSIRVAAALDDSTKKVLTLLEGTTVRQKVTFASTAADLAAAVNADTGGYLTASVSEGKDSTAINATSADTAMTAGTAPTVNAEAYKDAFSAFELYDYNVLTVDSHDTGVQTTLTEYAAKADEQGKRFIAVIGGYTDLAFDTRCAAAKACNAANVVYMGSGYYDTDGNPVGKEKDDTRANAVMAGYVASASSKGSVVHKVVSGATDIIEKLTYTQRETAIDSGMVVLSLGSSGQVWFDNGVTTLITPDETQDDGWKKIKRVKIRYELFDRIGRSLEPYIGQVNADSNGVGTIQQVGQKVIDTMVQESKLISGSFTVDTYSADSAWFVIEVVDPDTLEKIYLHYMFRYSQTA